MKKLLAFTALTLALSSCLSNESNNENYTLTIKNLPNNVRVLIHDLVAKKSELDSTHSTLEYGIYPEDISKINDLDSLELIFIKYDSTFTLSSKVQIPTHYSLLTIPLENHATIDYKEPQTELKFTDKTSGYFELTGDPITFIPVRSFYGIDTTRIIDDNHVFYYDSYPWFYQFDIDPLGFYEFYTEVIDKEHRGRMLDYELNISTSDTPQTSLRKLEIPMSSRGYHIPYIIFKYEETYYSMRAHHYFTKSKISPLDSNLIISNEANFLKHTPKLQYTRTEIVNNKTLFHFDDSISIHHEDLIYCYKIENDSIRVRDLKYDIQYTTKPQEGSRCEGSFEHLDSENTLIKIKFESQIF